MTFFHDPGRRLLIYEHPGPLIQQFIPEATEIKNKYVSVPQTLRNSQILRQLNYPVAPIMEGYDWPAMSGVRPWEHQKLAANFAVLHPRSFNLSDLGSGKTLSLLWAVDFLMKQYPLGECRCLIVAPLSTLHEVWAKNIFQHLLGRRTAVILHGSAERRLELLKQPHDFYILNHDGVGVGAHTRQGLKLDGFSKVLSEREDIKVALIDEASAYKDSTTKRHRIARLVFGAKPYLYMLTGTPTPQAPTDAYGLAKLLNNAGGQSFGAFQNSSMIRVTQFKWAPKQDGYDQARKLLSPAIRFDINDTWKDAPELTIQTREAPLTAEQVKLLKELKNDLQMQMASGQSISAANEAAARSKFLQISLGAVYDEGHKAHAVDASPRVALLKEILEQAPGKFLVLAGFTGVLQMLEKALSNYSCVVVNGSTPAKDRAGIFHAFQEKEDPQIMVADPGVLAHGLNLQRGRTIIWYGPTDKAELFQQANKRCHRPGQKYPVSVVQVVSNKLEREIYHRLAANASLQGALLTLVGKGEL